MRIIALFIAGLLAGTHVRAQNVTLRLKNEPLLKAFQEIEKQTHYTFVFTKSQVDSAGKITVNLTDAPLLYALDECLRSKRLSYHTKDDKFIVIETKPLEFKIAGEPESFRIYGKVTDPKGQPLTGVSIVAKGTTHGTVTDPLGNFQLDDVAKKNTLVFSYIGYKTTELNINNKNNLAVKLAPQDTSLENVVISTGYQKIEQKYLTGAVTSLKMDSINQPGLTTVDKMLEGRVPGLTYMQNSGQPGVAPKLRIRGTSTLLGSQEPLWVVDGIVQSDPVPISADKINNLDFVNLVGNAISGLNPNDIDQIDVLKDAAATALYGVRAANGVIAITTKRGKPGPPVVNYVVNGTYTRRPRYTDKEVYMMNSKERVDVSRELIEKQIPILGNPEGYEKAIVDYYNGFIDYDTYKQKVDRAETVNTDWFKAVTNDVFTSNHMLGISGGNQVSRYYASVGYTNDQGVIKGEYNKRYTQQIKFDVNYKNFKAQFSILGNNERRHYVPDELGILNYAYATNRSIPLYNEDGSLYYYRTYSNSTFSQPTFNVINEMNHSGQTVESDNYTGIANLNYQVIPGLQLNAVLSYTTNNTEQRTWFDEKTNWADVTRRYPGNAQFDLIPFGGELRQQSTRQRSYTVRGQADYSRYLDADKKNLLNITLGAEASSKKNSDLAQIHRGYYPERGYTFANIDLNAYPGYAQWIRTSGQPVITEGLSNLASLYMTATYIYNDRYILSASTRSDFSNAFGSRSNERFLPTYGISGRWNMHNDLLKNERWVDLAALRLSYGTQGNMLPNQTPYTIIQQGSFSSYYGAFGSTVVAFPNPDLKWEKTDSYNAGLDFSFLNNKINGSISFFYKRTTNAFLTKKVSAINGTTDYVVNGGTVENKGVELAFNFMPINNAGHGGSKRGFVWRVDPQLGQVFNTLLNKTLQTNNVLVDLTNVTYQDFLNGMVPVNGRAINTFYAYRFEGLDHNTGQPIFYGAEPGKSAELADAYTRMSKEEVFKAMMKEAGRRVPVIQGGVSNYMGYRNWSLNFTFTYSLGSKIRLLRIASGTYGTYRPTTQQNLRREFVDRWRYPGDELHTNIPGVQGVNVPAPWWLQTLVPVEFASSYYQMYDDADIRVVSGNYVKLQSADISYNFNAGLCNELHIKAARLSLAGSNLFTIAGSALRGQDVSQSGTTPNINLSVRPVYSFNINVSF